jgi:hypothetical protein
VRDGASRALTKLFVFGFESSCNILPTNFDFLCKNYRMYMCTPMSYVGSTPVPIRIVCLLRICLLWCVCFGKGLLNVRGFFVRIFFF